MFYAIQRYFQERKRLRYMLSGLYRPIRRANGYAALAYRKQRFYG